MVNTRTRRAASTSLAGPRPRAAAVKVWHGQPVQRGRRVPPQVGGVHSGHRLHGEDLWALRAQQRRVDDDGHVRSEALLIHCRQHKQRFAFARGGLTGSNVLLEHDVRVGATRPEAAHSGHARA